MGINESLPSLQSLLVFESAAKLLSFTKAAKELGTTQPAVSQQIRDLEDNLGCPLFERIYRGVELTETGERLLQATQKSFQTLRLVCDDIRETPKKNHLTVATDFAFAAYSLIPKLTEFRQLYQTQFPDMDIRLQTSQAPDIESNTDVDLMIVFGKGYYSSYDSYPLISEEVMPVCSKNLLDKHSIHSLEDLLKLPLLKLNDAKEKRWLNWDDVADHYELDLSGTTPQFVSDNFTLIVQMALAGQGVCLGWSPLIEDLVEAGVLVAFPQYRLTSNHGYHLVFPHARERSDLMEVFANWLSESMKRKNEN